MNHSNDLCGKLSKLTSNTKFNNLSEIMPLIDQKVREGVSHQDIVSVLNSDGIDIKLTTFRAYLYRYRKLNKHDKKPNVDESLLEPDTKTEDIKLKDVINRDKHAENASHYMNQKKPLTTQKDLK